eukprot:TRINITY_DN7281_c0_g1_i2.p1 TRINITY_DN7281_c0_g1~~TRINITY_DN7281_c0_g1_i2.p1  ORF type:complete len:126 (+),score=17.74 TRINITY_DN7281_c0_g1_i2:252-629(+)
MHKDLPSLLQLLQMRLRTAQQWEHEPPQIINHIIMQIKLSIVAKSFNQRQQDLLEQNNIELLVGKHIIKQEVLCLDREIKLIRLALTLEQSRDVLKSLSRHCIVHRKCVKPQHHCTMANSLRIHH